MAFRNLVIGCQNADEFSAFPASLQSALDRLGDLRVRGLSDQAHAGGKIPGTEEHRIDAVNRGDLGAALQRRHGFDLYRDQKHFLVGSRGMKS